jgi:uncharacterized protein YndB with AHSA1/START domain
MAVTEDVLRPILAEIAVEAPIERLWQVMTSEGTTPDWLGCMNYHAAVGATFHMQPDAAKRKAGDVSGATHCDIITLKPPHKFDFTWYMPGTLQTVVEISLFSEGPDRSFVRLVHSGWEQFPAEQVRVFHDQLAAGWRDNVLPNLKRAAEAA